MARLYSAARRSAPLGAVGNNHVASQRRWLTARAGCERQSGAAGSRLRDCLVSQYRSRILELAIASAYTDRTLALTVLRQRDPVGAPLVEALLVYAGHPAGDGWSLPERRAERNRITTLLRAPLGTLQREPDHGLGAELLSDEGVRTVDDVFRSDQHFAQTLKVLAVFLEVANSPLRIPCEAVILRPALMVIEAPMFGSSRDSFIPTTDCADALPAAPQLDRLDTAIRSGWPRCEGTIGSMAYASYKASVTAALIGMPVTSRPSSRVMPRRAGVSMQTIEAAQMELVERYRRYRSYPDATASATARERLFDLLSAAHACG